MSTLGPSPENRTRRSPVTPRRHAEPAMERVATTYDSDELPVLLRMIDVSRPRPVAEPARKVERNDSQSQVAADADDSPRSVAAPASRHQKSAVHRGRSGAVPDSEKRITGTAAARFWSTIPPQVAAGGMLLAVIALCFVLLRGTDPQIQPSDGSRGWSTERIPEGEDRFAETESHSTAEQQPITSSDWAGEYSSVAAKPTGPQAQMLSPVQSGWPAEAQGSIGQQPTSARSDHEQTPVQGWPTGLMDAQPQSELPLSAPVLPNGTTPTPTVRTSQLSNHGLDLLPTDAQETNSTPRLTGTVEIPPPKKFRQ